MAIIQCPLGHYYDDQRDAQCPYCRRQGTEEWSSQDDFNERATIYAPPPEAYEEQLTQGYGEDVGDADLTIGQYSIANGNRQTVGWLVCTVGPAFGKSYSLYAGRNFAGRSFDMDLVVSDDYKIARQKHFSVVYDPKTVGFFLVPESGAVLRNGVLIKAAEKLNEGDDITAGDAVFTFIPFCKEGRTWEAKESFA